MNSVLLGDVLAVPFPNHLPQRMSNGQSCGQPTVLCHAVRQSDLLDFNILPPSLVGCVCKCVHVKIFANFSSLIEQNIDRFGDGGKMGKNIVSFWRIKRLLHSEYCLISRMRSHTSRCPYHCFLAYSQSQGEYIFPHHGAKSFLEKIIKLHQSINSRLLFFIVPFLSFLSLGLKGGDSLHQGGSELFYVEYPSAIYQHQLWDGGWLLLCLTCLVPVCALLCCHLSLFACFCPAIVCTSHLL